MTKIAENVLLRNIQPPHEILQDIKIGDDTIAPTLFGWDKCKIKEFGDMGNIWGENQYSLFLLEKVENGIMVCLQMDKRAIEEADFR